MEPPQKGAGEAVLLLTLMDSLWFQLSVLGTPTITPTHQREVGEEERSSSSSPPAVAASTMEEAEAKEEHHHHRNQRRRQSPERKLGTILSGKEVVCGSEEREGELEVKIPKLRRSRKKKQHQGKKKSKSLSELEYEEMKGFMDLGFSFSDEEAADPGLASIVPGLQRLRNEERAADDNAGEAALRPYLSEAWEYRERADLENALRRWKLPAPGRGVDLRKHLRCWAHTVAWTVR